MWGLRKCKNKKIIAYMKNQVAVEEKFKRKHRLNMNVETAVN